MIDACRSRKIEAAALPTFLSIFRGSCGRMPVVVVAHDIDPAQRQHEPLIDLRHERHVVGGLRERPASVVVAPGRLNGRQQTWTPV